MKSSTLLAMVLCIAHFAMSQTVVLQIPEHHFQIDQERNLILAQIEDIGNYQNLSSNTEIILTLNNSEFQLENSHTEINYETAYDARRDGKSFQLYFTSLPIISLNSSFEIVDEPKVLGDFIYADEDTVILSKIGIELRGGVSQWYPKKTYDLELWKDDLGEDTKKESFLGLRNDDDWILDGLYNEPLRIRSNIAHALWLEIHKPYYLASEPKAKSGAAVRFVELFLNGNYIGLYNLSEQVDKKQLQLKDSDSKIKSELYKGEYWGGAVTFDELPFYDNSSDLWGGHQFRYPDNGEFYWQNAYNFTDFIMNAPTEDFKTRVWDEFHIQNNIDYFIFLNLTRATDNRGKNIYLAKYDANEPYFYVPWDLDGVFGTVWTGDNQNITDDIISNGFFDRALRNNPGGYLMKMQERYWELREDVLSDTYLEAQITQKYSYLKDQKIYERERLVYSDFDANGIGFIYMKSWLENRLNYLDEYFSNINTSVIDFPLLSSQFDIYPNPSHETIYISNHSNSEVQQIKVFDLQGQLLISHGKQENHTTNINFAHLSAGTYLVQIISDSGMVTKKVVKN